MRCLWRLAAGLAVGLPLAAAAQPLPPQQQQPPQQPAPPPATSESPEWAKLPRMELERQFAGPLQDTIIQRWRDPVDGMICYIYLPITAAHSAPTPSGFVQYGGNTVGSISCVEEKPAAAAAAAPKRSPGAR